MTRRLPNRFPIITVDTNNPDPTNAIIAFEWCLAKARELGMSPPTEHHLAELLFRQQAKIMFYSSMNGVTSLVMDEAAADDLLDDDTIDFVMSILRRRAKARREQKEREAEEATAQGMLLRENSRSEVEAEGQQPGPLREDAPQ